MSAAHTIRASLLSRSLAARGGSSGERQGARASGSRSTPGPARAQAGSIGESGGNQNWNGRYLSWGDGGKDGALNFADHRVGQGYATANSNMGHDSGSEPEGWFGASAPERT
jgi:hypothetical protein